MITFKHIYKSFGKHVVFEDLNLDLEKGGIWSVLGPNGSGKTTLMKILLGLVVPDKGTILMDGEEILKQDLYRKKINYMPQIARFPENLKVREIIAMIHDIRQQPADEIALVNRFDLGSYLDVPLKNLSGGTRQKVNAVLAFMHDNPVIVLDEPTVGLDPVTLLKLKELIQEEKDKGKLILLTTHITGLVEEISDQIVFLLEGKVFFQGTLDHLFQKTGQDNLERSMAAIMEHGISNIDSDDSKITSHYA